MLHGTYTRQLPTAIRAVQSAPSALPLVVGTAPVHTVAGTPSVNKLVKLTCWQDVLDTFGYVHDFKRYTLMEFLYYYFRLKGFAPVLAVNEFDPSAVATAATFTKVTLAGGVGILPVAGALVVHVSADVAGATDYVEGEDYTLTYNDAGYPVVQWIDGGDIATATSDVYVEHKVISESLAGVDAAAIVTGIGLIDQAFAQYQDVPSLIACPGYSQESTVNAAMLGKATYGGGWQAYVLSDIDTTDAGADAAVDAAAWKNSNGFTSENQDVWWGLATIGDDVFHLSTIAAGELAACDRENADIPFVSASNRALAIDGMINAAGTALFLTDEQANDSLNANGIGTCINHSGWRTWGNYTGAYPGSNDPAEIWRNFARMRIWLNNSFRLDISRIDGPANIRSIESIVNSRNIELNGIAAQGGLVGKATVEFRREDNPLTSMLAGQYVFHVAYCPPTPLQAIVYDLSVDATQLETLFTQAGGAA